MARRARGTGNIRERPRVRTLPDGTKEPYTAYEVRWYGIPDPLTGKREQERETVYSRADAEQLLRDRLSALYHGTHVSPDRVTVGELLSRWLEDEAASRIRPSTLDDYRMTVQTHLIPRIGSTRAQRLTAADVHKLMAEMERAGVGARTRQLALLRLKQALKWAVSIEMLRRNVAEKVRPPKAPPREGRVLTSAEQRDFLTAAQGDPLWPLWRVYLMTGLRRGEALGLRWSDLDLTDGILCVRQAVQLIEDSRDSKTRPLIGNPKSASAVRAIHLDGDTEQALIDLRVCRQSLVGGSLSGNDLVFCTVHGTPLNPSNVYRNFKRIKADAGLDDIKLHDLRHTHLTECVEAGMDWLAVAARAGHADPSITHGIYGHHRPGRERGIIDRLAKALHGDDLPGLTE